MKSQVIEFLEGVEEARYLSEMFESEMDLEETRCMMDAELEMFVFVVLYEFAVFRDGNKFFFVKLSTVLNI